MLKLCLYLIRLVIGSVISSSSNCYLYSEINNLVEIYNLKIKKNYYLLPPRLPLVVLETDDRLNTFALGKKFVVIDGIVSAKRMVGSSSAGLSAIDDGSSWDFEYFYSWGACNFPPVECQFIHYWVVNGFDAYNP